MEGTAHNADTGEAVHASHDNYDKQDIAQLTMFLP
jgi:hypothetical protein